MTQPTKEYFALLELHWKHDLDDIYCAACGKKIERSDSFLVSDISDFFCLKCGTDVIKTQKNYNDQLLVLLESLLKKGVE
jgi:predicted RNA-binding Zn-ribbon protein involved in translation (DUF1610 family)